MSENSENNVIEHDAADQEDLDTSVPTMSELDVLKNRARMLGINFSNNIGVDTLKAKIEEKMAADTKQPEEPREVGTTPALAAAEAKPVVNPKMTLRQKIIKENMRLIRCRITNLDPKKKDLPGEIITVANEYLGTVRKFIPYGEATDNGYHIPYCLYKMLKNRKFLQIRTRKGRGGTPIVESEYVREFAIEELPQLTEAELAKLAAQQAAQGRD